MTSRNTKPRSWLAFLALAAVVLPLHAAPPAPNAFAQQAQRVLEQTYAADAPGAVVLVARGDDVLLRTARGVADLETGRPLTPDARLHIGSLTKQMVAVGIMKLVEAGKVSLDDPLTKYVPDFVGGDRVVVAQLLNHTSGITGLPDMARVPAGVLPQQASTDDLIAAFKHKGLASAPGERFAYNDSGYILAAKIIESASGKPWHVTLTDTLFRPLSMNDTCYCQNTVGAVGHVPQVGRVRRSGPPNVTWEHGAGAIVTTASDLLKWNRALHTGRVLAPATYRQWVTPRAPAGNYAFGIDHAPLRGYEQLSHSGSVIGYAAHVLYLPGPGLTVVVLRNVNDGREYEAAANVARRLALMALGEAAQ